MKSCSDGKTCLAKVDRSAQVTIEKYPAFFYLGSVSWPRCCRQCGVAGGEQVPPAPLGWYYTDLSIVSWNIHGVFSRHSGFRYNKLHSPIFQRAIGNAKIFGLLETHRVATDIDHLQIPDYKCYNVCRKKKKTRLSCFNVKTKFL